MCGWIAWTAATRTHTEPAPGLWIEWRLDLSTAEQTLPTPEIKTLMEMVGSEKKVSIQGLLVSHIMEMGLGLEMAGNHVFGREKYLLKMVKMFIIIIIIIKRII